MPLVRQRSLRQYLMAFGAALLAPVLVLAAVLVWQFARAEQRQSEERAGAERIVVAVDRELAGLQAAGQALASSAALRAGDHERFQRRALEAIRALPRPENYAIVGARPHRPAGRQHSHRMPVCAARQTLVTHKGVG